MCSERSHKVDEFSVLCFKLLRQGRKGLSRLARNMVGRSITLKPSKTASNLELEIPSYYGICLATH